VNPLQWLSEDCLLSRNRLSNRYSFWFPPCLRAENRCDPLQWPSEDCLIAVLQVSARNCGAPIETCSLADACLQTDRTKNACPIVKFCTCTKYVFFWKMPNRMYKKYTMGELEP
jgi:hypothetical protein